MEDNFDDESTPEMDDDDMPEMMDDDMSDLEELDDFLMDDDLDITDPGLLVADNTFDRFQAVASVDAVFGEPVDKGNLMVIPAAEVVSMMGFGIGSGTNEGLGGGGGGGGGWNTARPVALVIASERGVEVQPVVDVTKIAIAALTTVGFMAGLVFRMLRPRRR